MEILNSVGARLKFARQNSGVTQEHIANICGLTKGAISQIEMNGNSISGDNLFPIADALGVSARWLITGMGDSLPSNDLPVTPAKVERISRYLSALPEEKLNALSVILGIKL